MQPAHCSLGGGIGEEREVAKPDRTFTAGGQNVQPRTSDRR